MKAFGDKQLQHFGYQPGNDYQHSRRRQERKVGDDRIEEVGEKVADHGKAQYQEELRQYNQHEQPENDLADDFRDAHGGAGTLGRLVHALVHPEADEEFPNQAGNESRY